MRRSRRRGGHDFVVPAAVLTAVVAVCLALWAIGPGGSGEDATPAAAGVGSSADTSLDDLTVLRRPQRQYDRLPPRLGDAVAAVGGLSQQSRRTLSKHGRVFHFLPATDGVCITMISKPEAGQGYVCHTRAQWVDGSGGPGRIFLECPSDPSHPCATVTLFDVVPDGVRTVTIERERRSPLVLPVESNVYVLTATANPHSAARPTFVTYERAGGSTVRQRIYLVS